MPSHQKQSIGCYVRVSTENQIENYSIDEQIQRLKAYCLAKDWPIYKFYTDAGYSGGNLKRPAMELLLQDIHRHKISLVIVYKLDRLSRSQKDTLTLIEDEFLAHNVDFVSISENFDTSTPFGRAMIGILSVFAQLEKDQITERFTMGRIGRSKAGYYHGGSTAPTGYNYIDGNLVVDECMANQVKEVYTRFLNGYSIHSIQRYMHEQYGSWSSHALVNSVLRNSLYTGKVKFAKKEYQGNHQPIIEVEAFEKVQELLHSPDRENAKSSSQKTPFRAEYILSGLVRCVRCGARYSANHGYYKCCSRAKSSKRYIVDPNCKNENWSIPALDQLVIDELYQTAYEQGHFKGAPKKSDQCTEVDTAQIKKRAKELDAQIAKLLDLYQYGEVPVAQVSSRIAFLQKEKSDLNDLLAKQKIIPVKTKEDIQKMFEEMDAILTSGTTEEKRAVVAGLVEIVWVDGVSVSIQWRF